MELKHRTWKLLRDLHRLRDMSWLCAGDFNEILHHHEKEGGFHGHRRAWTALSALLMTVTSQPWGSPETCSRGVTITIIVRTISKRDWTLQWQMEGGVPGSRVWLCITVIRTIPTID